MRLLRTVLAIAALAGTTFLLTSCGNGGGGYGGSPTAPPPPTAELNSGTISGTNGSFAHRFFAAGTFPYHCTIHASMTGYSVVVSDAAPANDSLGTITFGAMSVSQNSITIHTGGKVTWTNNSGANHTVTSGS